MCSRPKINVQEVAATPPVAQAAAAPSSSPVNPNTGAETDAKQLKRKAKGKKGLMITNGASTGSAKGVGLNV